MMLMLNQLSETLLLIFKLQLLVKMLSLANETITLQWIVRTFVKNHLTPGLSQFLLATQRSQLKLIAPRMAGQSFNLEDSSETLKITFQSVKQWQYYKNGFGEPGFKINYSFFQLVLVWCLLLWTYFFTSKKHFVTNILSSTFSTAWVLELSFHS